MLRRGLSNQTRSLSTQRTLIPNTSLLSQLQVLKHAANRLIRAVRKYNNKAVKALPTQPELTGENREKEKQMLHYLAELRETVEAMIPDAKGTLKQRIRESKKIIEDERFLAWKGVQSAIDPDAHFGWKTTTESFFGYKESIAMTEDGIITAVKIEAGNQSNPKALLVQQTKAAGVMIEEVIADKAYGTATNLQLLQSETYPATIALNQTVFGLENEQRDRFTNHKDSDTVECPAGHHSIRKAKQGKKNVGKNVLPFILM